MWDWWGHRVRQVTGFWSHGVDTKLGRVENSGTGGRRNRWGDQRDTDGCTALLEDTEAGVCSVGVWTEETFILGVGPTFYTSLLDGGGVCWSWGASSGGSEGRREHAVG